jgi:hypothetical protein
MDELFAERAEVRAALGELADAERACREAERIRWPYRPDRSYARRVARAMSRWQRANLAVFDAQVAAIFGEDQDPGGPPC